MGSLEDKVARLSPEQRHEVEGFIDFVLQKNVRDASQASHGEFLTDSRPGGQVNPVILAEEKPLPKPSIIPDPLPVLEDLRNNENSRVKRELQPRPPRTKGKDPGLLLDWIE